MCVRNSKPVRRRTSRLLFFKAMQTTIIHHENYESDFLLIFQFDGGRPGYPWTLVFSTQHNFDKRYSVSFDGEHYNRCRPIVGTDDGITVEFNDHRLGPGILRYKLYASAPDTLFSDGQRDTVMPVELPIELWNRPSDDTPLPPDLKILTMRAIGVPAGGRPGQVLVKSADADYATNWGGGMTALYEAAGIHYNPQTGYYELNGLTDLTERQAAAIYTAGPLREGDKFQYGGNIMTALPSDVRTNLCYPAWYNGTTLTEKFRGNVSLEVALIISSRQRRDPEANSDYYTIVGGARMSYCFDACPNLRRVIGVLSCENLTSGSDGWGCRSLEEVWLRNVVGDFNMKGAPKLSLECVRYMVKYAAPTKAITFIYHPDVYSRALADAEVQAALPAQPFVALASA